MAALFFSEEDNKVGSRSSAVSTVGETATAVKSALARGKTLIGCAGHGVHAQNRCSSCLGYEDNVGGHSSAVPTTAEPATPRKRAHRMRRPRRPCAPLVFDPPRRRQRQRGAAGAGQGGWCTRKFNVAGKLTVKQPGMQGEMLV